MTQFYPEGSGGWAAGVPYLPSYYRLGIDTHHEIERFGGGIDYNLIREGEESALIHGWKRGTSHRKPSLDDNMGEGEDLDPQEFEQRISEVVDSVQGGGRAIYFDLFPGQQSDDLAACHVDLREVGGRWEVKDFVVRLPEIDMSSRDVYKTMYQLGNYLEEDLTLPINNGTYSSLATIFQDVPYLVKHKRRDSHWEQHTCISGRAAAFIEEIVDTFVNESTADTLDQYSDEISGPGTYYPDPTKN